MEYDDVIKKLENLKNPKAAEGMARYGITPKKVYGVSIPNLSQIAKEIGKNHGLAQQLWESNIRETRILACMIDDPEMVSEEQMEDWVKDFDYWEICDQCIMKLFKNTRVAYKKAFEWSSKKEEFVKRAGFVLIACLAASDKEAENEQFEKFLQIIKRESNDNRVYVKKAVNWALRQIGKRNQELNRKAIKTAKEIQEYESQSAKWIASDALRELKSEAIQKRLKKKKTQK
ncbi:MAG: DNA alkylation repair protein [Candidatus Freyarchaeota archaeon]|nr:DNA alkylation repair protein [Candidatus Jordarchaeia archaeon]MBS7267225.1 DNA alkylation repair protein [Candidatus Jordarchaeia archaeon]MBS7278450.1 DNA alkylation repair protein [Candidatus Jordarchaeia archaeon]